MSGVYPPDPRTWNVQHGGCGVAIASDVACDRPAGHFPATNHRSHNPSGTGTWIEFDGHGRITARSGDTPGKRPTLDVPHNYADSACRDRNPTGDTNLDARCLRCFPALLPLSAGHREVERLAAALPPGIVGYRTRDGQIHHPTDVEIIREN